MSSFINTGVILIKNAATSFRFIDAVLKHDLNEVRTWWDEQQHGLFTGGDQDKAIMTLLHDGYIDDTLIVTHERLNSRDHLYSRSAHDAFICHFCGHYDRKLSIAHFAKRYHLSPDLLPPSIARKYGLTVATMSPLETALRQRRRNVRGRLKPFLKPVRDKIRNSGLL
mgnify:CR=1 FL=1